MRYALLALSTGMLTGGAVAAQSALGIAKSASATIVEERMERVSGDGAYGSLPFTATRAQTVQLATR